MTTYKPMMNGKDINMLEKQSLIGRIYSTKTNSMHIACNR